MTQEHVQAAGRVLAGRYALLGELGRGGMGIVWLAEDRTIGRRVAIKELCLPAGVGPAERTTFEERVLREARAAGRLNDPGVVTVYDVLTEGGATYIVMELIAATTLSDLVRDRGPLPPEQVVRLAEDLLSALSAAHEAGVVHRDVKPSNIMVAPNGRAKLTDFGIAHATDDPRLTTSGILVGSPVYLAPERIRGADADAGSDLWALGAVLFFAVEGYAAFERSSTAATMHAIVTEVPYLTRCHGPHASVNTGLLNTQPTARPSVAQVRGLLARAERTPQADLTTQVTHPAPRPRRNRGAVVAAGLVGALALFAGGFLTRLGTEPDPPSDRPAEMDEYLTYGSGGYLAGLSWGYGANGLCFNSELARGSRITEGAHVDCDGPHLFEVYESRTFYSAPESYENFPDIAYPGQEGLAAYAEPVCRMIFDSAKMDGVDDVALRYRALVPAKDAWDEKRSVHCVLYHADHDQLTRSFVLVE